MATRSAIGYKTPEGKIRAKYSHYDGYPAYTGVMLEQHYQQARKIAQMVELGDQSGIAPNVFPTGRASAVQERAASREKRHPQPVLQHGPDRPGAVHVRERLSDLLSRLLGGAVAAG